MSVTITTECAHCQRTMQLIIDSDMQCHCEEIDCKPIIFVPDVDFGRLKGSNIIEAF